MNDKVKQVGQLMKKHSQAYTVYNTNGLCPTLSAGMKRYGGLPTYIIEIDEEGIPSNRS